MSGVACCGAAARNNTGPSIVEEPPARTSTARALASDHLTPLQLGRPVCVPVPSVQCIPRLSMYAKHRRNFLTCSALDLMRLLTGPQLHACL
jgi:hypothetical protein